MGQILNIFSTYGWSFTEKNERDAAIFIENSIGTEPVSIQNHYKH